MTDADKSEKAGKVVRFVKQALSDDHLKRFNFWGTCVAECGGAVGFSELSQFAEFESLVSSEDEFLSLLSLDSGDLQREGQRVRLKQQPTDATHLNIRPIHEDCPNDDLKAFFAQHGEIYNVTRFTGPNKRQVVLTVSKSVADAVLKGTDSTRAPSGEASCPLTKRWMPPLHIIRVESVKPLSLGKKEGKEGQDSRSSVKDGMILKLQGGGFATRTSVHDIGGFLQNKYCPSRQFYFIDYCDEARDSVYVGFSSQEALRMTRNNIVANPLPIGGHPFRIEKLSKQEEAKAKGRMAQWIEQRAQEKAQRVSEKLKRKRGDGEGSRFQTKENADEDDFA